MCARTRVSERGCGCYCVVAGVCMLERVAVCCVVLQCCSVLERVCGCYCGVVGVYVLELVAVCCSVLRRAAVC